MAKFFLVVLPSCLKKLKPTCKCAVTNVDWNNLTFEFLAKDEQNLLGATRNFCNQIKLLFHLLSM